MADDPNPNPTPENPPANPPADPPSDPNPEPYFVAQTKEEFEQRFGPTRLEGRESERKGILEKAQGAKSIDNLIEAWNNANEVARQLEGEEIQQVRSEYEEKLGSVSGKAEKYEATLEKLLEKEREGLPEHITSLLDDRDPADQLAWIAENREAITEAQRPASVGRGSAPGEPEGGGSDVWNMPTDDFLALQQRVMTGQQGP
jgi:hypothetical protein